MVIGQNIRPRMKRHVGSAIERISHASRVTAGEQLERAEEQLVVDEEDRLAARHVLRERPPLHRHGVADHREEHEHVEADGRTEEGGDAGQHEHEQGDRERVGRPHEGDDAHDERQREDGEVDVAGPRAVVGDLDLDARGPRPAGGPQRRRPCRHGSDEPLPEEQRRDEHGEHGQRPRPRRPAPVGRPHGDEERHQQEGEQDLHAMRCQVPTSRRSRRGMLLSKRFRITPSVSPPWSSSSAASTWPSDVEPWRTTST